MKYGDLKVGMKFRHAEHGEHEVIELKQKGDLILTKWQVSPGGRRYDVQEDANYHFDDQEWVPVYMVEGFEV